MTVRFDPIFDLIHDPDDWKRPIDVAFHEDDIKRMGWTDAAITNSIAGWTATEPTIRHINNRVLITADGYRMGPAGACNF
jgi:hypothetical protein